MKLLTKRRECYHHLFPSHFTSFIKSMNLQSGYHECGPVVGMGKGVQRRILLSLMAIVAHRSKEIRLRLLPVPAFGILCHFLNL